MRALMMLLAVGLMTLVESTDVRAQYPVGGPLPVQRLNESIGLPGLYGTSWGVASFGVPRTYSTYSSSYGSGYGYGYPSYGFLPGPYGVGLWRPGFSTAGYTYGAANGYNTFPYPYKPGGPQYSPPIGVYAPGFGPGNGGQPASVFSR